MSALQWDEVLGGGLWYAVRDGDKRALALYMRHYSAHHYKDGRVHNRFVGPGERIVLLTGDCKALWVWRKMNRPDLAGQEGVCCSVFRNESPHRASDLIKEAEGYAREKWGMGERCFTYVDPRKVTGEVPGYCFRYARWKRWGETQGGLLVLEKYL